MAIIKNTIALLRRRERRQLLLLLLLDILISVADVAALAGLLFVVHFYTQPAPGRHFALLPARFADPHSVTLIAIFVILFSLKNLAGFLVYRAQCRFAGNTSARISRDKLSAYLHGGYDRFIHVDSAVQIRKISNYPVEFCQHVLGGMQQVVTQSTLVLLTVMAMLFFNTKLFLFLFAILLPPVVAVFYFGKKRLHSAREQTRVTGEKSLQYLRESLSGYIESNIYDKHHFFLHRFSHWQNQFNQNLAGILVMQGLPNRLMEIFALLGLFVLIAGGWSAGNHEVLLIGAFMAAAYKIIPGIVKILNNSGQIKAYEFTLQALLHDEPVHQHSPPVPAGEHIHSIECRNISFAYPNRPVFENICFELKAGNILGITGFSGKGKTTLLHLLLGFLPQSSGDVLINGKPVTVNDRRRYWPLIAYVRQQPFLIHDTLLHNIALEENGTGDGQYLRGIIETTGLAELLDAFPEKMDKLVAENGRNLSGGQRQRIALARALYKNADLIILDEPFSELDATSEYALLQTLKTLSRTGKLVILVTHNKKSLGCCDHIMSLDAWEAISV